MRVKLVKSLCGDEILAESLYSSEKVLLIPKGTALKSEYIELLYSLEIKEIYVEDIYEMEERRNVFLSKEVEQQLYEEIKCILEKYIYKDEKILKKIRPLAKKIVHIIVEGDFKELLDYDIHAAELYTHTLKVTYMCILLGQKQNMNLEQLYDLAEGALFHDIGIRFISVPYKNFDIDKMKPEQLFEMKRHTILGYSVLDEFDWISQTAKDMVLSHHEKLDGTGYPLKQRNTQKACKIIQICDTIDGMYCGIETKRYTMEKIYHYFQENGQCYEQEMVEQIFSIIARYPAGTVVKLNNDRKAVVVQQTRYADRPVIKLIEPVFGKTGEEINMIVKNDIEIIGVCE